MQEIKPFRTIHEQIGVLRNRGLIIKNEETAEQTLKQINYYRLSGYTLTLRKNDVFYNNITFDDVLELYDFDSCLRTMIFRLIEHVEISFRAHVAYYHSKHFGADGYLNNANFINSDFHNKFIDKFNENMYSDKDGSEIFIKHHKEKYEGSFPFWVVTELITFSDISKLYGNLPLYIQKEIAKDNYIATDYHIRNWLRGINEIRNICAHFGRLYNRILKFKTVFYKSDVNFGIKNDHVFADIYALRKLIRDEKIWRDFMYMLLLTIEKHPFVRLSYLGFPNDWQTILSGI